MLPDVDVKEAQAIRWYIRKQGLQGVARLRSTLCQRAETNRAGLFHQVNLRLRKGDIIPCHPLNDGIRGNTLFQLNLHGASRIVHPTDVIAIDAILG